MENTKYGFEPLALRRRDGGWVCCLVSHECGATLVYPPQYQTEEEALKAAQQHIDEAK